MEKIKLEDSVLSGFFDETTMSVHLKENVNIIRKKWVPWNWQTEVLDQIPTKNYLTNILDTLYKEVYEKDTNFLEINRNYSKVFQIWPFRTVIVLPPVSDWIEITIVKPTNKLTLEDYNIDPLVADLLKTKSKWILISGAPWEWKTTFAQALIELYVNDNKIVKTIESPRDLIVPKSVTQYSFSHASHSELRDILLLSRPDYTVYDEVRNWEDFILYKDLRLTWIWLIWVTHATQPVDSIQRLISNVEMWAITQIVDTVIFIKAWKLEKILRLAQVVKVPEWMESSDLSRPVIQLFDFYTQEVEYEIYSYWEQIVVMPIKQVKDFQKSQPTSKMKEYAIEYISQVLKWMYDFPITVQSEWENWIKIFVPDRFKWQIIWKWGIKIQELEKTLWLSISVKAMEESNAFKDIKIESTLKRKWNKDVLILQLPPDMANKSITFMVWKETMKFYCDINSQIDIKRPRTIKNIQSEWISILSID